MTIESTPEPGEVDEELVSYSQTWEGPIPPPAILQQFDEVVPGLAQIMVDSWVREQEHRRGIETEAIAAESREAVRIHFSGRMGIVAALLAIFALSAVAVFAVDREQEAAGILFGIAAVVSAIFSTWGGRRSPKEQPPQP